MATLSFSRGQMVREATLTEADLAAIAKCRRAPNRLGFAYQVGFVRLFHRFPTQHPLEICDELLNFVAMQLNIDATQIDGYAARQHTVSDHQASIRAYLKLAVFDADQVQALERFVFEESSRLEQTAALLARAREFLTERRVLFPADSALLRLVGEQRRRARAHIVTQLAGSLSPGVVEVLDGLLEVRDGEAISGLQRIKANPARPSASAMQGLADKLAAIEATGVLAVDLSWLNANYQRALFHYVRKSTADRLREVARPRRLAALVCFLRQSYRDAVDSAVDMFDKLLTRTQTRAEHELSDQMRRQRQTIKEALAALRSLGAIILDETVGDAALRSRLFDAIPRETLEAQVTGLDEWVTGKKSDVFHGLLTPAERTEQEAGLLRTDGMRPIGTPQELERRRRRAVELVKQGESPDDVARFLGCGRSSVYTWLKWDREAPEKLAARPQTGRPPRLDAAQHQRLERLLLQGAKAHGWRTELRTAERVAALIERHFGIHFHPEHARKILKHKLGWTSQRPQRRARERDEAAIAH